MNANESQRYSKAAVERNHCRPLRIEGDTLRRGGSTPLRMQAFDERKKAIGMRRARVDVDADRACASTILHQRCEAVRALRQSRTRGAVWRFRRAVTFDRV
ncbi:hypothetical protein [Burkholderia cenocepacia]|uniref:hypothetical protein n=1 Tax=Burkholderia cenocepacia TaxID=95486 RepID=UPI0013DF5B7B|nr:hypothetical protein [Burkholderia cenocepacia]